MRATLDLSQVEQEELFELSELVALEIALEAERDLLENGIEREEFAEKGAAFLRDVPEDGEKGEGGEGGGRDWKGSGKGVERSTLTAAKSVRPSSLRSFASEIGRAHV